MTPKSCSQRPQNHATLETQSIFPSRKGHIWKSKTSSIQTISRPSTKKRYTGYTVYNLKPKQFCVQKVSTVSTIGLQPILNPLSPRRGTTAPAWDDSRNCPPPGDFHAWEPWVLDGVRVLMLEVTHQKGYHCISMDFMGYMMD
jgi:hypothetical protein